MKKLDLINSTLILLYKMNKLRVIFMGTPNFAVESLKQVINSRHEVVAVVTAPDRPFGRGHKIRFSPVKQFALSMNLPIFQPEKLESVSFLQEIKSLKSDIFIVVAFRYLPQIVWSIPQFGTFNLHASLLPDYRGAAPINYTLINGEEISGVTTFLIDNEIDTGEILLKKSLNISPDDNAGTLHDKLMILGGNLVVETLDKLAQKQITPIKQATNSNKLSYKIFKKNCKIDWNQNSKKIHNLIRGLSPYPCSFSTIIINRQTKILKIYKGNYILENHTFPPGKIEILKHQLKIYTQDGFYFPEIVQLEGKQQMSISNFLNGLQNKIFE